MQASARHAGRLCCRTHRGAQKPAQAYSNNRGPEPSTSFAPDASRGAFSTRPADGTSSQQNFQQQYATAPAALISQPPDTGSLQRSDVADKEVISTVTGSQLGVLSDLLVDSTTMTVAALCLGQKTWGRKGMAGSCLELAAMVQVGDVVLVNQDAPWPRTYAQTFQKLRGCQVYTYNGIPLGKVRNFSFDPDTGSVTAVQYDELGFPSIPESWVMLWEADVQSVHDLRDGRLTLKPRAQPLLLRNGAVGRFVSGALSVVGLRDGGNAEEAQLADQVYQDWCRRHGETYRRHYGRSPPESREEYEAFSLGYEAATGTRAPLQLPAPQNRSARDAFVADQGAMRSMEAMAVPNMARRDPRTRRQVYDAPARQSPYAAGPQQPPSRGSTYPTPRQEAPPAQEPGRPPRQQRYPPQPPQFEPQTRQGGGPAESPQRGMLASQRLGDVGGRQGSPAAEGGAPGRPEPSRQYMGSSPPAQPGQQQRTYLPEPGQRQGDTGSRPFSQQGAWAGREEGRPQQRPPPPETGLEPGQGRKSASIPLMDPSPRPHQRRDADGNFGDAPASAPQVNGAPAFREWAVDDQQQGWDRRSNGQVDSAREQLRTS